ncbi:ABC transporter substrate-binding protein [Sphingomonas sp.]|uniref:ABC transporter substrate-binding protein n=1 Tax=Sphingomonas sp. TaxID=28214 RepID=UPI002CA2F66B|nr:ABC transporter substrate-binding protein [Sphingomonas sp.]HWK35491.1 ABC transporter substrate-binding protein [Sphingomonas sp.]
MDRRIGVVGISRRGLIGAGAGLGVAVLLAGCGKGGSDGAAAKAQLVDLRQRNLTPRVTPAKLSIDDGRYLVALSLIHPDPVSTLAAWSGDVQRLGKETYDAYVKRFPALATLATVPPSNLPFQVEPVLAARPDVALVSLGSGPSDAQVAQLEGAGVSVAFIDFFSHPIENQAASLTLLGALTGRGEQAAAYNAFRKERLDRISARLKGLPDAERPSVFMEPHAGLNPDCCNSPGSGNVGDYIAFVGGRNIGADQIKQPFGKLSLEYVISRDPDIYIATGGPHLAKAGGFVVGPGFTAEQSQAGLRHVIARNGISTLRAVREKRVHGLSHQMLNSPIDVVAVEVLAKWLHPDRFGDLDPAATLAEINSRFLAVPYDGSYWADLAA